MANTTRKPEPQTKQPAQEVLNKFLEEKGILIGTERPKLEFTQAGAMVMYPPSIFAVYKEEVMPKPDTSKSN